MDLYTGSLSEPPLPGAIVGPTLACLLADQFVRTKRGDRFWYESPTAAFSPEQLRQLRRTSLATVLCDNGDDVRRVRRHTMRATSDDNPELFCALLERMDLEEWREHQGTARVKLPVEEVAVVAKG